MRKRAKSRAQTDSSAKLSPSPPCVRVYLKREAEGRRRDESKGGRMRKTHLFCARSSRNTHPAPSTATIISCGRSHTTAKENPYSVIALSSSLRWGHTVGDARVRLSTTLQHTTSPIAIPCARVACDHSRQQIIRAQMRVGNAKFSLLRWSSPIRPEKASVVLRRSTSATDQNRRCPTDCRATN